VVGRRRRRVGGRGGGGRGRLGLLQLLLLLLPLLLEAAAVVGLGSLVLGCEVTLHALLLRQHRLLLPHLVPILFQEGPPEHSLLVVQLLQRLVEDVGLVDGAALLVPDVVMPRPRQPVRDVRHLVHLDAAVPVRVQLCDHRRQLRVRDGALHGRLHRHPHLLR